MPWQFTRPANVAREVVHRLVAPSLGWLVDGPQVSGREWLDALPAGSLICPNHESHLDVPVLRRALGPHGRRRLAIAAADDYWFQRRANRLLITWFAAIPFRRVGSGVDSIKAVEALLDGGWRVVIFPEGSRSRDGELHPFKGGIGVIATRTGREVLPVRIDGLWEVLPPGHRRPNRGHVTVRFGEPLRAEPDESARAFTARLDEAIRRL